jgi:hypothetical protein
MAFDMQAKLGSGANLPLFCLGGRVPRGKMLCGVARE